ncbi:MAG TPA: ribose 5-phosphate isomerase A [Chloroflexi bacterium]|nr:ribose 5-phosphate isomerase A [Chloroflexota bacterium]
MDLKRQAALHALQYVHSGNIIGLGSGSTMTLFIEELGALLKSGELSDIVAVPTSEETAQQARQAGVKLSTLDEYERLDIAIDGADEVDNNLNLVKGLGRALLREKVVATHADEFVIIVDNTKLVTRLGERGPVPIEVVSFAVDSQIRWLTELGCVAELWLSENGSAMLTDNGNPLVRCWFEDGIDNPEYLASLIKCRVGIVEHGLFLDMATKVIVAHETGITEMESAA